jgi:hypothetical protein
MMAQQLMSRRSWAALRTAAAEGLDLSPDGHGAPNAVRILESQVGRQPCALLSLGSLVDVAAPEILVLVGAGAEPLLS